MNLLRRQSVVAVELGDCACRQCARTRRSATRVRKKRCNAIRFSHHVRYAPFSSLRRIQNHHVHLNAPLAIRVVAPNRKVATCGRRWSCVAYLPSELVRPHVVRQVPAHTHAASGDDRVEEACRSETLLVVRLNGRMPLNVRFLPSRYDEAILEKEACDRRSITAF